MNKLKTNFTKLLFAMALSGIVFTSCSKDDAPATDSSSFTVNPDDFQGTISKGTITLDASKTHKLTGKVVVENGATLVIPAGTKIEGVGGTSAYVAVAQGGKIEVNGTAEKPVVMTSGLTTKKPGDWGGLVICGKAPINRVSGGASSAQSEVADLSYGGDISTDNSGIIKYLRIEYSGAAFNTEKEFNGISFFGVGSGTVVENVEVYAGSDDGFEFFGGTVNTKNLISIGNEDDQFDWTEGWVGTNENWYAKLDFGKGNRGIEADNYEFGFANTPIANPAIKNMTLIGAGSTADAAIYTENQALKFRRGTKAKLENVYISNWKTGIDIEHDETIATVADGSLKVTTVLFDALGANIKGKTTAGASADVSAAVTEGNATGAGNGKLQPDWANGWSVGF